MRATDHPSWRVIVNSNGEQPLALLCAASRLPPSVVAEAMSKGAVWCKSGKHERRLRHGNERLNAGDLLQFWYEPRVLALTAPAASCVADARRYSLWFKPAGLLAQGSRQGDHCALLRQVELHFTPPRPALLVHRLDRETSGLMVVAHDGKAAAGLSQLLAGQGVFKAYLAQVCGAGITAGWINQPLDGQASASYVEPLASNDGLTLIAVYLASGRQHQIRRHLAAIGHPLWGDPRYGQGNKNSEGLALQAQMLAFTCPFTHKQRQWRSIPPLWALTQLTPEALEGALSALYQRYQQQPRPPEWGFAPR